MGGYEAPSKEREPDFEIVRRLADFFGVTPLNVPLSETTNGQVILLKELIAVSAVAYNKGRARRKEVCPMELKYTVILEVEEDGHYIATVPALKGCHSFGCTREEALQRVREAIELYLECLAEACRTTVRKSPDRGYAEGIG